MEIILYSLSEISLFLGILWLLFGFWIKERTIKSCFRATKLSILLSGLFSIVFYNKTSFLEFFTATSYTTTFYIFCTIAAFIWISLSYRWFTSMHLRAESFCILALAAVFCFKVVISTINMGVLFGGLLGLSLINYLFIRFSQEAEDFHQISFRYGASIIFFAFLMLVSLACLTTDNWNYQNAREFIVLADFPIKICIALGAFCFILFLLGIAPFHFGVIDVIAPAVLPVAAYLGFVSFFALWAVFIQITPVVLSGLLEYRFELFSTLGLLSVFFGAVGVHSSRNIKRIFGFTGLYNMGIILIILAIGSIDAMSTALVYMQIYVLTIIGVYACFYSFKSSREYLNNISMLNSIALSRPLISIFMVVYLFSLAGLPPLAGFMGQFSVLTLMVGNGHYIQPCLILVSLLVISSSYIRIIHAMYFAKSKIEYDRPDNGIYLYLILIGIVIAMLTFKPQILMDNALMIANSMELVYE